MEVARSNNFVIKYDKFDWNLHLTKVCLSRSSTSLRECMHAPIVIPSLWLPCGRLVSRTCAQACSEASRQPQRLIANHAQPNRSGGDPSPTTLGSNQVFTPSLHESGSGSDQVATKVYNQQQQQQQQQRRAGAAVNGADRRQYSVPVGGQQRGAGQQVPGLQNADQPMDGFMC